MDQPDDLAAQPELQLSQFLSNVTKQLPAKSFVITALPAPSGQLHDAVPSGKTVKTMMAPPGNAQGHPPAPGYPATLPAQPQKTWLIPPEEWQPGEGLLDKNHLYSFTLPMIVANTPHNTQRGMSGMDIRDVCLVQAIHGGISNWLLRPFAHGRFVTWEGFRTRRGLALEHLFEAAPSIPAPDLAHFGERLGKLDGTQH